MSQLELLKKIKADLEGKSFTFVNPTNAEDKQVLTVKDEKFHDAEGNHVRLPGISWIYVYNLYADENGITEKLTEAQAAPASGGAKAPRAPRAPAAPKKPQGPSDPNGNTPERITYYTTPAQKALIASLTIGEDKAEATEARNSLLKQWEGKMDKPTNAYLNLAQCLALGEIYETTDAKGINSLKSKTEWVKSIKFAEPEAADAGAENGSEA